MALTKASQVFTTPDEEAELQKLQEEFETSRQDALIVSRQVEKAKQEKALLEQATGGAMAM